MGDVKVKLNLKGINEVMKSPEILAACEAAGRAVANAAGPDHGIQSGLLDYIAYCDVVAETKEAKRANYEDNVALKAVSAVGLKLTK